MLEPQLKYDLEDPAAAENTLRAAVEAGGKLRDPSLTDSLYRRGRVRRELHKYHEALIDFRTALEGMALFAREDYVPPPYLNRANIYVETARVHTLTGEVDLAEYTLNLAYKEADAYEDYPNWADIHLERARILMARGDFVSAEEAIALALEHVGRSKLDAGLAAIHLELAVIKAKAGEYEACMFCLHEALGDDPTGELRIRCEVALGDVLWLQEKPASALWHYHKVKLRLEARARAGAKHLADALKIVTERIEKGRQDRHSLYNVLLDDLQEAVKAYEPRAIVEATREVAHLAATFGEYQRARSLVSGVELTVAVAALAFHMLELSDPLEDDTEVYEHDYALHTDGLPEWEQELADLYLE